nr:MAG TPA: minor structural protein [Caudoviricetes sp.]
MEWIKKIIEKHTGEDGKLNLAEAIKEINKEAPKNVVPKDVYNTVAAEKKTAEAKVKEYEGTQLSEAEKQQQAIDEANAEKEKYQKMANKLEVEKVLITAGMQEDDYKDFIDGIVTSDKDASVSVATAMATTFKTKMAAAEAQVKNDQLKNTPRPGGGDGSSGETKPKDVQLAEQLAETANTQGGFTAYLKGE